MNRDRTGYQRHVYVIGHRQPDADSICSVIGYAELLNQKEPGVYLPARCGEMNDETRYALARCGAEPPVYVESVEPSVEDLPYLDQRSVRETLPTIDVAAMMDANDMRNMPVVDNSGKLVGLISEYGLARAYVTQPAREALSLSAIDLETLARILHARILVTATENLGGRVYTAIDALHVALSRLTSRDLAIVGDNEPAQLALTAAGIAALIVADDAPVGERVLTAAKNKGVSVLATPLDAFGVGKMINLSLPGGLVMETEIPTVQVGDSLEYAKHLIGSSKFRTACVVDEKGVFLGQISRSVLMQEIQKSVILLDHNETSQAVDGIEHADILEIVDHHRLGAITTLKPVKFLNDPVGSTSTIITIKFMQGGTPPASGTACLLLAGILSDTLGLRMSTTTVEDRKAVEYLQNLTGLDAEKFSAELIEKGMNLSGISLEEILARDTKRYTLYGKDLIIAQVMVPDHEFHHSQEEQIRAGLHHLKERSEVDLYLVLFTSVAEGGSEVYVAGEDGLVSRLGLREQPWKLENVMSRKKDFLPLIGQRLRSLD